MFSNGDATITTAKYSHYKTQKNLQSVLREFFLKCVT